jgi:hypothetical protein
MTYGPPLTPPAPRPRQSLRPLFIVLAIVAVGCLGGAVVCGVAAFRIFDNATQPARDAADAFVEDLADGDHSGAYDRLCHDTLTRYELGEFTQEAHGFGQIVEHRFTGVGIEKNLGAPATATVTAELTIADGQQMTHTFSLVEEGDDWKVCGDPF